MPWIIFYEEEKGSGSGRVLAGSFKPRPHEKSNSLGGHCLMPASIFGHRLGKDLDLSTVTGGSPPPKADMAPLEKKDAGSSLGFRTDYVFTDRKAKARYVWLKYQTILCGKILDVGADECHLKNYLPVPTNYWGIGLGGHPDQRVDLEKESIPFAQNSFDCVLCLDVLEHLENIHAVFDELCRVTRRYVILSLPNPWSDFFQMLRVGDYQPGHPMKFYGLPPEPPPDRHKWFFSYEEALRFILYRAERNQMVILQIDYIGDDGADEASMDWVRKDFYWPNLFKGSLWAVLEKKSHE
jgi:SAM-dependent methyltransferase